MKVMARWSFPPTNANPLNLAKYGIRREIVQSQKFAVLNQFMGRDFFAEIHSVSKCEKIILLCWFFAGERYDFVISADQPVGAYWIQLRGLGECGIKRAQQLAILRYARGPYQPASTAPTYDVGIPQGVVSTTLFMHPTSDHVKKCKNLSCTSAQNKTLKIL